MKREIPAVCRLFCDFLMFFLTFSKLKGTFSLQILSQLSQRPTTMFNSFPSKSAMFIVHHRRHHQIFLLILLEKRKENFSFTLFSFFYDNIFPLSILFHLKDEGEKKVNGRKK